MDYKITYFEKHNDERGDLVVFLRNSDLAKQQKKFGQIYFVTFSKKGIIRGNHYHKKWREWFGIVAGKLQVVLENIKTKEKKTITLDAKWNKYVRLEIGPYIAHTIISIDKYSALLNYTNLEWNKYDTFQYKLL